MTFFFFFANNLSLHAHQLKESDPLASLLTLFKGNDAYLQQCTVAALERLLSDAELLEDFRRIPLVLSLLEAEKTGRSTPKEEENKKFSLLYACCSLLARVSISDMCAVEIVKANGIHLLDSWLFLKLNKREVVPSCCHCISKLCEP